MKRILCIWLPNWPIQRLMAARPELNRRAVILYAHHPRNAERVVACSSAALALGVRVDMPLAEATSLAGEHKAAHEPAGVHAELAGVHAEPHDPRADRTSLEQLAQWCERFSPIVGLETADPAESLLLNVTGLEPFLGSEDVLVSKVVQSCSGRGYAARVAIAGTIGAAWAMAHFADPAIAASGSYDAVESLPIEALRLSEETVVLLHRLGILRIEQLTRLPRASLTSRFGYGLVERLDQALGIASEVIVAHRPLPDLKAAWSMEHPSTHRAAIERVLSQLVERVAGQLAERNEGAVELECRLCGNGDKSVSLRVGLFQPTAVPRHLMELVRMQFESLTLPGEIGHVSVSVTASAPLEWRQYELLADKTPGGPRQLAMLVNRLSSRLGRAGVVSPQLQAGAQPERAYRYAALTGADRRGRRGNSRLARPPPAGPLGRPLWLRSPPPAIEVVAAAPDGPPAMLHYQNQSHHVARHWGPERIETRWWRGRSLRRDYYRVETSTGSRFWIFRRLQDGRWFLHGEFA